MQAGIDHSYNEMAEGAALLKNINDCLPLKQNERKISVFSNNSIDMFYCKGGEGNAVNKDTGILFDKAMADAGFEINPVLWDAYAKSGAKRTFSVSAPKANSIGEAPISVYTSEVRASFDEYNDAAIIVLVREAGEGSDAMTNDNQGISQLAIHQEEKDMIELVRDSGKFEKIIVLINSTLQIELDFTEEDYIDSVIWVGTLGMFGSLAIPDILTGKVNPSGSLPDTWAANSLSAPAVANENGNTPGYANKDYIKSKLKDSEIYYQYQSVQIEGIYVGFKYYETRYEDAILNQGNASDSVGAISGSTEWNYAKEMNYPFGHGESYTTFATSIKNVSANDNDTYSVTVNIKNTGSVAGKKGFIVYAQTPYGDYEKDNKIEKSAIQSVQFGKSKLLEPNEEEDVTVTVDKYLLASYDANNAKTYIISEGDYYFAIGDDVHDALNNILSVKGATGMIDALNNPVAGDSSKVYSFALDFDKETFSKSKITNKPVVNRFEDCDVNHFFDAPVVTYLTRNNWKDTFPVAPTIIEATDEMIRLLEGFIYKKAADAPGTDIYKSGVWNNVLLADLIGKDINDPLWDTFLDQFTYDQLGMVLAESLGIKPIPKFGVPRAAMNDGPLGLVSRLPFDQGRCPTFPGEPILAATLNHELIQRRGELLGEHCLWNKTMSMNGPGVNLHKTPFNGRSHIYFSEDSNLTYLVAYYEAMGYRSKGASAGAKHFVLNDQETGRIGISQFFTEQSIREGSLRAFESTLTTDHSYASMMAFNRVGCVSQNSCKASKDVAREEWGFEGFFQTDAGQPYAKDSVSMIYSGTNLFTADSKGKSPKEIVQYIEENNDGVILGALRDSVKYTLNCCVHSNCMNGLSKDAQIIIHTPWWQTAEIALCISLGVVSVASLTVYVLFDLNVLKKKGAKKDA